MDDTKNDNEITRTSKGLRDALFDEIDGLRRGEVDPKRANAVARLAAEIVNTVKMEVEVEKYMTAKQASMMRPDTTGSGALPAPVELGNPRPTPPE